MQGGEIGFEVLPEGGERQGDAAGAACGGGGWGGAGFAGCLVEGRKGEGGAVRERDSRVIFV